MDELDQWINLDGPEPESIRTLLDSLRDSPPPTPEEEAQMARAYFARLDGKPAGAGAEPPAEEARDAVVTMGPRAAASSSPLPAPAGPEELPASPAPAPVPLTPAEAARAAGLASTALSGDTALARAVAALSVDPSPDGGPVRIGGMKLEHYASFCAERAVWPEEQAAILGKYHLRTPEALAELDEKWERYFVLAAPMRAVFETTRATFTDYLRAARANGWRRP